MPGPSITDWITAGCTVVAVGAAIVAALYTKRSASEAAKAAKAAADQVELQRPMPIVVATFSHSLSDNKGDTDDDDKEFQLANIGDSPAFDVEVSPLETPGELPYLGAASRLSTERLSYLLPASIPARCTHRLEPDHGAIVLTIKGMAGTFATDAARLFDERSKAEIRSPDLRYEIQFELSYRALDGRRFRQPYVFVLYFQVLRAWIEPVGSLLKAAQESI
jgi:hypothetical protein